MPTVSEEEVEAVAIFLAYDDFGPDGETPEQSWRRHYFEEDRQEYRRIARAALEAAAKVRESRETPPRSV